jgi:hypothetical protein
MPRLSSLCNDPPRATRSVASIALGRFQGASLPCSSDRLRRASGPALKASSAERCNLGKPVGRSDCALGRRPVRGRMPDRWPCRSIFFPLQRSAQGDAQRSEHRPRQVPRCFAPCSSDRLLRASGPALKASSAERCNLGKPVGRSDCALGRRPVRGRMPDRWPCRSIFFLGLFWVVGVSSARCAVSTRAPVSAFLVHVCS